MSNNITIEERLQNLEEKEEWKTLASGITYRKVTNDVELNIRLSSQTTTYASNSITTLATLPERIQTTSKYIHTAFCYNKLSIKFSTTFVNISKWRSSNTKLDNITCNANLAVQFCTIFSVKKEETMENIANWIILIASVLTAISTICLFCKKAINKRI